METPDHCKHPTFSHEPHLQLITFLQEERTRLNEQRWCVTLGTPTTSSVSRTDPESWTGSVTWSAVTTSRNGGQWEPANRGPRRTHASAGGGGTTESLGTREQDRVGLGGCGRTSTGEVAASPVGSRPVRPVSLRVLEAAESGRESTDTDAAVSRSVGTGRVSRPAGRARPTRGSRVDPPLSRPRGVEGLSSDLDLSQVPSSVLRPRVPWKEVR